MAALQLLWQHHEQFIEHSHQSQSPPPIITQHHLSTSISILSYRRDQQEKVVSDWAEKEKAWEVQRAELSSQIVAMVSGDRSHSFLYLFEWD